MYYIIRIKPVYLQDVFEYMHIHIHNIQDQFDKYKFKMLQHRLSLPEMHVCVMLPFLWPSLLVIQRAENMIKWHCILFMSDIKHLCFFFVLCA